jgi:hypothetical protein
MSEASQLEIALDTEPLQGTTHIRRKIGYELEVSLSWVSMTEYYTVVGDRRDRTSFYLGPFDAGRGDDHWGAFSSVVNDILYDLWLEKWWLWMQDGHDQNYDHLVDRSYLNHVNVQNPERVPNLLASLGLK